MSPPKADNKSEAFPFGEGGSAQAETDEVVSFLRDVQGYNKKADYN